MEIKKYAPVIIPTLNRFAKFKECLESLEKCTGAEFTDVYVALDYPPSSKYEAGWNQIEQYLNDKQFNNKFNKLVVWKRDHNYGICHRYSNSNVALEDIRKKYDRFIFTEDDNIFSVNFLQYINKGLELFKDDNRFCCVCGYNYPMEFPEMYKNNFYISKNGSPWGFGCWFERYSEMEKYHDLTYLKQLLKNDETRKKLQKERPTAISSILHMIKENRYYGDTAKGCFVTLENRYWLMPRITKVKNSGADGSGAHSRSNNEDVNTFYRNQILDTDEDFEFSSDIFTFTPIGSKIYSSPRPRYKKIIQFLIDKIDLFLFLHFNYIPKSKYI